MNTAKDNLLTSCKTVLAFRASNMNEVVVILLILPKPQAPVVDSAINEAVTE